MTHKGSCHCGKVKYEVEMDLGKVISCNCSICQKKGTLLAFAPAANFKLLQGENNLTDYQFNKHVIHHLFCSTCGVTSFSRGKSPAGQEMCAINVRCLDGVQIEELDVIHYDGRSL